MLKSHHFYYFLTQHDYNLKTHNLKANSNFGQDIYALFFLIIIEVSRMCITAKFVDTTYWGYHY